MWGKSICILLAASLLLAGSPKVSAAEDQQANIGSEDTMIVSTSTVDDDLYLFVKSSKGELDEVSYQVGTSLCDSIKEEPVSKLDTAMKTLVLIDNSFSISQENRHKIKEMLLEFIAEKKDNELVKLATFDKKENALTDYITDYTQLKKAVQSIKYQDQETYLTDVLYDVLDNSFSQKEEIYNRIIVISDGVDNKSVGYTKEELYNKVEEKAIPIYTFGCSDGKNNEELKNMFAISRASKAKYYLMGQIKDVSAPVAEMAADRNIVRLRVEPKDELLDGSVKSSKLVFKQDGKAYELTADVTMPFKVEKEEPSTAPVQESTAQPKEEEMQNAPASKKDILAHYLIYIAAGLIAAAALAVLLFIVFKRRKKHNAFEPLTNREEAETEISEVEEPTEIAGDEEEMTCRIWDEPMRKTLVLTDIKSPSKSFQMPLIDSVIIGRSHKQANLVIDYDKSVSSRHCEIELRSDNRLFIIDLHSSNGTYVNGNKVLTETEISSGAILKLGRLEFKLEIR